MLTKTILKLFLSTTLIFTFSFVSGCSDDDKSEDTNVEQVDTIPVVVKKIEKQPFTKSLSYFTQLRGIKETTEGAAIGGRIEKINFSVGSKVKKDDIIIEFPNDSPASQYRQAKTAFETSLKNYERVKALLDAGETSQANFDGVEAKYLVDKSNFETQHDMLFVKAPYDGVITGVMINEGDNVKAKDPLFSIANLNKIQCKIWASAEEIKQIKKGMKAIVDFDGNTYEGKVTEISLTADPKRRAFYAEIVFPNGSMKLKSGLTVSVKINIYENSDAIVVARNLVQSDQEGNFVYVFNGGKAHKKYLELGSEMDIYYEIKDGLVQGENLIVKGGSKLFDKALVKLID